MEANFIKSKNDFIDRVKRGTILRYHDSGITDTIVTNINKDGWNEIVISDPNAWSWIDKRRFNDWNDDKIRRHEILFA